MALSRMEAAIMVVGFSAEAIAWAAVVRRQANVWIVMTSVLVGLGIATFIAGPPAWSPDVAPAAAVAAGFGGGVALYLATRGFVSLVRPWTVFRRHSLALYGRRGRLSLGAALLLSAVLSAPGEELFWRGLFQAELLEAFDGAVVGAVLGWVAYVAANLPSANLAIVSGAVVGGAVWTGLGVWSGGALAPLACHAVWTALMIGFPVVRGSEETM